MGLEDIPEIVFIDDEKIFEIDATKIFYDKFIIIEPKDRKPILVAGRGIHFGHMSILSAFCRAASKKYQIIDDPWTMIPSGGGMLKINSEEIRVFDKSQDFGKYNVEVVRPIIENFAKEKYPIAKIIFE